jgi:Telomere resolvase
MKTTTLDLAVSQFIAKLKALSGVKARERAALTVRKEMRSKDRKLALQTILNNLGAYRKAVRENFTGEVCDRIVKNLTLTVHQKKEIDAVRSAYRNRVELKNEQPRTPIYAPETLVNFAVELLTKFYGGKQVYTALALGLMLLTGRRAGEILKTAKFSLIPNQPRKVFFEGQLKLKNNTKREASKGFVIPVLADAHIIIKALATLREIQNFEELTTAQVHQKTANPLGLYAKKYFTESLGEGVTPHSLRKAYLALVWFYTQKEQSNPTSKRKAKKVETPQSKAGFARAVLGHSGGLGNGETIKELTTSTYLFYEVIDAEKPQSQIQNQPTDLPAKAPQRIKYIISELVKEQSPINQTTVKKMYLALFGKTPNYKAMVEGITEYNAQK